MMWEWNMTMYRRVYSSVTEANFSFIFWSRSSYCIVSVCEIE